MKIFGGFVKVLIIVICIYLSSCKKNYNEPPNADWIVFRELDGSIAAIKLYSNEVEIIYIYFDNLGRVSDMNYGDEPPYFSRHFDYENKIIYEKRRSNSTQAISFDGEVLKNEVSAEEVYK